MDARIDFGPTREVVKSVVRRLWRRPAFPLTVGVLLAIGLGDVFGAATLLRATTFRPIPWHDAPRLGLLVPTHDATPEVWSVGRVKDVRTAIAEHATVTWFSSATLENELLGRPLRTAFVDRRFFDVLGLTLAQRVRGDGARDDGGRAVILSARSERLLFGGESSIGRPLVLGEARYVVAGVVPPGTEFPLDAEAWVVVSDADEGASRDAEMLVRLAHDANVVSAWPIIEQRMAELRTDLRAQGVRVRALFMPIEKVVRPDLGRRARIVVVGVSGVLLLVLLNIATVTLLRALHRRPELALAAAFGASTRKLVAESAVEIGIVALVSLPLALVIERAFTVLLVSNQLSGASAPALWDGVLVKLVAWAIIVLFVAALSIVPILRLRAANLMVVAKGLETGSGSGRGRTRQVLLALQLSATTAFAILGLLVVQTHRRITSLDFGFRDRELAFATVNLTSKEFADPANARIFANEFAERASVALGTRDVAIWGTTYPRMHAEPNEPPMEIEGRILPAEDPNEVPVLSLDVSPSFFRTLGVDLVSGRGFDNDDAMGSAPVAIVDEVAAARLWPGESAIGKRIRIGGARSPLPWMTVVGVVRSTQSIHQVGLEWQSEGRRFPLMYRPFAQASPSRLVIPLTGTGFSIAARGRESPEATARTLERLLADAAPRERFEFAGSLTLFLDRLGRREESRQESIVFLAFGIVGLVLALFGLARVIDEVLARRTRELGIRAALGASPRRLVTAIAGPVGVAISIACVVGAASVLFFDSAIQRILRVGSTATSSNGPVASFSMILAGGSAIFVLSVLVTFIRAARAVRVDPSTALRAD